jgi:hypothetical protein
MGVNYRYEALLNFYTNLKIQYLKQNLNDTLNNNDNSDQDDDGDAFNDKPKYVTKRF